jgi:hypothetical protein
MKRFLILSIVLISLVFFGCQKDIEKDPSPTPSPTETEKVDKTDAPTPEPTEEKTPEPTKEPLPGEQLGIPQDDAEIIYLDDFVDNYINPEALFRYNNGHEVVEEQLYLSTYKGVPVELVDTYSPDYYCEAKVDGISQVQFHLRFKTSHERAEKDPWMSAVIGVRVYEPMGNSFKPSDEDSGMYMAVTQFNKILVYHGIPGQWPRGAFSMEIPNGFGEMCELVIVDTGDKLFYYQKLEGSELTLFMTIELSDQIKCFDADGNEVYSADNNLKEDKGGYFKIFNHFGRTVIDEFSIKVR